LPDQAYRDRLPRAPGDVASRPVIILGSGVAGIHRNTKGETLGRDEELYLMPVKLTVVGISEGQAGIDEKLKSETSYWIGDDSRTSIWQYDNQFVYVPFERLQQDLRMDERKEGVTDLQGNPVVVPARTSEIHVKVKDGVPLQEAKKQVERVVRQV